MLKTGRAAAGETLGCVDLFAALPPAGLAAAEARCRWLRFDAGRQIIGQRDPGTDVYFVAGGRVRVVIYAASGQELTFRDIGRGEVFGELAAIDGEPRSATVVALVATTVAAMSQGDFWNCVRGNPEVAEALIKRMSRLLRFYSQRLYELGTLGVQNRVHAELLRLARDHLTSQGAAVISPLPRHQDIANRISTRREAVAREMSRLAKEGIIERRHDSLHVPDVARLERMVEEMLGEAEVAAWPHSGWAPEPPGGD